MAFKTFVTAMGRYNVDTCLFFFLSFFLFLNSSSFFQIQPRLVKLFYEIPAFLLDILGIRVRLGRVGLVSNCTMGLFLRNKFSTQFPSTSRNSSRKWHGIASPKESHGEIPRHGTDVCSLERQMNQCICQEIDKNITVNTRSIAFRICIYIYRIFFFLLYPPRIAFPNHEHKLCKPYLI